MSDCTSCSEYGKFYFDLCVFQMYKWQWICVNFRIFWSVPYILPCVVIGPFCTLPVAAIARPKFIFSTHTQSSGASTFNSLLAFCDSVSYTYVFSHLTGNRMGGAWAKRNLKHSDQKVCTYLQLSVYLMPPGKIMNVVLPELCRRFWRSIRKELTLNCSAN